MPRRGISKKNFSTKGRTPFCFVYVEACLNEQDAKRREDYLKTTQGGRFFKLRIKDFELRNAILANT